MNRVLGLFVWIVTTGGCGAENWSFDHDAAPENTDVPASEDAMSADARSSSGDDAARESGPDAGLFREAGPLPEAARRCSVDGDCPPDAPLCVQPAGECVRCTANVECARDGGTSVCNSSTGACVECTSSSDCTADDAPDCDTTTNRCVQCLSSVECGLESTCQLASHTCMKMF